MRAGSHWDAHGQSRFLKINSLLLQKSYEWFPALGKDKNFHVDIIPRLFPMWSDAIPLGRKPASIRQFRAKKFNCTRRPFRGHLARPCEDVDDVLSFASACRTKPEPALWVNVVDAHCSRDLDCSRVGRRDRASRNSSAWPSSGERHSETSRGRNHRRRARLR
jgi:hypothetical protein